MTVTVIGIDPGASGAVAVLIDGRLAEVSDIPTLTLRIGGKDRKRTDYFGLLLLLRGMCHELVDPVGEVLVMYEEVGPMPRDGATQAFNFGASYGIILGVVTGMGLPMRGVRPADWKRALKLRKEKDHARKRAMELWPHLRDSFARVMDDGRAEAALIALYGYTEIVKKGTV